MSLINIDSIKPFFHLPLDKAAQQLGVSTTTLKTFARLQEVPRWPFRRVILILIKLII